MSKVYVLECNGLHKIGVAQDVESRIQQLQTGNGNKIKEIYSIELYHLAFTIEKELHTTFKMCRVTGEWFKLAEYELELVLLKLRFEKEKLSIVGTEEMQEHYTYLHKKARESEIELDKILIELMNLKYRVEA